MLYAKSILNDHKTADILYDVKCSKHVGSFIERHGGNPIMVKTGHAFIKNSIFETNAMLAGEMSGHIFFNDRWFGFDDALYAGVRVLEILSASNNKSLDEIFARIPQSISTPEIGIAVPESKKFYIIKALTESAFINFKNTKIITIDGVRVEFSDGWALVRASNTTPRLVCRFEADTKERLVSIQLKFTKWINDTVETLT